MVLVTGATGAVGPATVRAFAAAGHRVRVLARGQVPREVAQAAAEIVPGDITRPDDVARAVAGAGVVVHLAALLHVPPGAGVPESEFERVNVGGTRVVVDAARAAGVARLVFASTVGVYGDAPTGAVAEDAALAPASPYARTKLAAERIVFEMTPGVISGGGNPEMTPGVISSVVLRFAAVYGPHLRGNYRALLRAVARGRYLAPGRGAARRSVIFDDDAAQALVLAATHPAAGGVFNVAHATAPSVREVTDAMAAALGRRPSRLFVPMAAAAAAAAAIEVAARATGRAPAITRAQLRRFDDDFVVDAGAIARVLGFQARVGLEEGWRRTIDFRE